MDLVHTILVGLHSLGALAIVVGAVAGFFTGRRWAPLIMVWSARTQLLTGIVLAALALADDEANLPKLAVKLTIAVAVAGAAEVIAKRGRRVPLLAAVTALTITNMVIAYTWH